MSAVVEGVVMCPATAARCRCRHELGHGLTPTAALTGVPPLHECTDTVECDGAWRGSDADGDTIEAVRYPKAFGLAAAMGLR